MNRFVALGTLVCSLAFTLSYWLTGDRLTLGSCIALAVPLAVLAPILANRAGHYASLLQRHLGMRDSNPGHEYKKLVDAAESSGIEGAVGILRRYQIYQAFLSTLAGYFIVWTLTSLFVTLRGIQL